MPDISLMLPAIQFVVLSSLLLLTFNTPMAQIKSAARVKMDVVRAENIKERETLILPYAFSTEDMGAVFGVGAMATGQYQKQMSVGATAFGGPDAKGLGLGI